MNIEWIYLGLIALMMVFCCYPMMRMMMKESDKEEQPSEKRTSAESADVKKVLKSGS